MKSHRLGKSTSKPKAEILNISKHGIWILVSDHEYFLPIKEFPWFSHAKISEIYNFTLTRGKSLHWPSLDVDLELDSLADLEKYPLVYK